MVSSKRSTPPAFQLYAAEFMSGEKVCRMSYTEIGMFTILLCQSWLAHGLPNNVDEIGKMLKVHPPRFRKIWSGVLHECWIERGGKLVNPKQERIRQKLAEYSRKQGARAAKGWQSRGNAAAVQDVQQSGNALQSSSSSSSSKEEQKSTQRGAPIHTSHKSHASCGRVCVPAFLHTEFVSRRNHSQADQELRRWYDVVHLEWIDGVHKEHEPGDALTFWRARYAEKWPSIVKPAGKWDNWQPPVGVRK